MIELHILYIVHDGDDIALLFMGVGEFTGGFAVIPFRDIALFTV